MAMATATPKAQKPVEDDPFDATPTSANKDRARSLRHSQLDSNSFTSFTRGSPSQAKRALEAHLLDTDKRIQDASKLGTTLLEQKKQLAARLKDLEAQQGDDEIGADLKLKLNELEKEYNEVGRETARAFIPKSRGPSTNFSSNDAERTPLADKGTGVNADNKPRSEGLEVNGKGNARKTRNQNGSKHDLEFATEISTSLLGQVRSLQNALMEKEDQVKRLQKENTQMQSDAEVFSQRMRGLDDQEQRYRDENWTLETQVQDLTVQIKELATKEHKLQSSLNAATHQKSTSEREYEELRLQHGKLSEDHTTLQRKHDVHVADLKRDLTDRGAERDEMQKRIDELYSQNQDLAKAVAYRVKTEQGDSEKDIQEDDVVESIEVQTPESSPPGSPIKATPRHGGLESETLKSSLHHAHRMIQNLKNNMHREKTEKVELKRMLQDARDEIEQQRAGGAAAANAGRKRQPARGQDAFKKPAQPGKLGGARGNNEWEDYEESPTKHGSAVRDAELTTDASDAFETADERAGTQTETETDAAFESAADTMAGSSDGDLTETEGVLKRSISSNLSRGSMGQRRHSLESTASDEGDGYDLSTPPQQPKYKLKLNRGGVRRSETPGMRDSPASFVSNSSQPRDGLNLASELENMDDASSGASSRATTVDRSPAPSSEAIKPPVTPKTPDLGRRDTTVRSSVPPLPKRPVYIDSGMVTEAWEPEPRTVEKVVEKVVEVPSEPRIVEKIVEVPSERKIVEKIVEVPVEKIVEKFIEVPAEPKIVERVVEVPAEPRVVEKIVEKFIEVPAAAAITREAATQPTPEKNQESEAQVSSIAAQALTPRKSEASVAHLQISGLHTQSTVPVEHQPRTFVSKDEDDVPAADVLSLDQNNKLAPSTQQFLNDILAQARLKRAENAATRSPRASTAGGAITPGATQAERSAAQLDQPSSPALSFTMSGRPAREPSTPTRAAANGSPLRIQKSEKREDGTFQEPTLSLADPYIDDPPSTYGTPMALNSGTLWTAPQKPRAIMVTSGTQTAMTNEQIGNLEKHSQRLSAQNSLANSPIITRSPASGRAMSMNSSTDPNMLKSLKRPSSSSGTSTTRSRATEESREPDVPPLPPRHQELIAQAKDRSSSLMNMPPPNMVPMSKVPRDRSSSNFGASPVRGTATIGNAARNRTPSMAGTMISRRSSMSSFASEIDERFNTEANRSTYLDLPAGAGAVADPRMIQAITQTMIGEFLWKYTRKAGRGDSHSENRHRRFFWIHPYTRTLYWSNQDPSTSDRNEQKAKSVAIEAVRVISDDNPLPPGLSNKSIVVVTPGRSIKFTAPTSRRHEVWFNALSYLLLRSAPERDDDITQGANIYTNTASYSQSNLPHDRSATASSNITADDLADFNPSAPWSRTTSRLSHRSANSATTRKSGSANNRTASPQGRAPANSLAYRQSQAAAKRAASTLQPSPLNANPITSGTDINRRSNALAAAEAASNDRPETADGERDAEGFRKPKKPERPESTNSSQVSQQTGKSQGRLSSFTSRISRASFASLGRGRKATRAEPASAAKQNGETNGNANGSLPADPATLATLDGSDASHEHVYKTQKRDDGTLENVRACCGGKHDLSSLRNRSESRASLKGRSESRASLKGRSESRASLRSQKGLRRSLSQRLSGVPAGGE